MIRLPPRSTRTDTLFPDTTLFRSNRITVQWERPTGYFRNAETVFRERLTFPDSPRIRESRCKRPQLNFVSYLLKELTAPAALPLFSRFLDGRGKRSEERGVGKGCVRTCRSRWLTYQ